MQMHCDLKEFPHPHSNARKRFFKSSITESIMKKLVLSLAVLSAFGAASIAQAAPAEGAKGLIKFTGVINADTCVLSSPSGTIAGKTLTVDMDEVPAASLGIEDAPTTTGNGLTAEAKDLDLDIQCATGTKVSMTLTPSSPASSCRRRSRKPLSRCAIAARQCLFRHGWNRIRQMPRTISHLP